MNDVLPKALKFFLHNFLIFILIGLIGLVVLSNFIIFPQNFGSSEKLSNLLRVVRPNSTLTFSSQADDLKVVFDIKEADQERFKDFLENLGMNRDSSISEVKLRLNPEMMNKINPMLPLTVKMEISPKKIEFLSNNFKDLSSSVPNNTFHFATSSGVLNLEYRGANNFDLAVSDPQPLVFEATTSGKIYLSPQLQQFASYLLQVDKFSLKVNNIGMRPDGRKSAIGSIELK